MMMRRTGRALTSAALVASLGAALVGVGQPAQAVSGPHTFSCALSWQPDVPRATGVLTEAGIPADIVAFGATGPTARLIYYFTGPLTPSAVPPPYRATPLVYDA